jgi:large subunit ribosomal protein L4
MSVVLSVISDAGLPKGTIDLSDDVFGCKFNESLIHQVVISQFAGRRAGTRAQKNRARVSGGGIKPWKQKGSGRARAGTIRSPLWRGGGVTFAAAPQDYSVKTNKKMYRGAMRSILSELIRQDRMIVVDKLDVESHKTKTFLDRIKALKLESALIVTDVVSEALYLSSRNLFKFFVVETQDIDPALLIKFPKVLITEGALKQLEDVLQ